MDGDKEKPKQIGEAQKAAEKSKTDTKATGTPKKEQQPAGKVVTNANDLQSFGNLNRLRNIDKTKKVETELLNKNPKSSPSSGLQFKPNTSSSKEKPLVSTPIIQYKPKTQTVQPGREFKRKSAPLPTGDRPANFHGGDMLIDVPDLSIREKRVFKVDEIAPTALEMGIDAMNLSHPVTLPFLTAKAEPIPDDDMTGFSEDKKQHFKENELLFFQFPSIMPYLNEAVEKRNEKPKEGDAGHMKYDNGFANTLQHIKEGKIGKMYVLKSGKVKLQIGDNMFEVAQGMPCSFLQELHYLNLNSKEIFNLGEIDKRIVVTPDLEVLLQKKTVI
jgi:DNA-directed RNA polymerase III subunit RPC4